MDNTFFPVSIKWHIILALLALLVFGAQFIRYRKSHHLILAVALPCTLLPYLSDSQTFFYTIGVFEGVALLTAFLLSRTVDRDKEDSPRRRAETDEEEDT